MLHFPLGWRVHDDEISVSGWMVSSGFWACHQLVSVGVFLINTVGSRLSHRLVYSYLLTSWASAPQSTLLPSSLACAMAVTQRAPTPRATFYFSLVLPQCLNNSSYSWCNLYCPMYPPLTVNAPTAPDIYLSVHVHTLTGLCTLAFRSSAFYA